MTGTTRMAVMIAVMGPASLTEDVVDHAGEAEEGDRQDRGGDQRDWHTLEGRRRVVVLDAGADAGENASDPGARAAARA